MGARTRRLAIENFSRRGAAVQFVEQLLLRFPPPVDDGARPPMVPSSAPPAEENLQSGRSLMAMASWRCLPA
jgi:hypothetical protein